VDGYEKVAQKFIQEINLVFWNRLRRVFSRQRQQNFGNFSQHINESIAA
jgi:hypothetical protein